LVAVTNRQLIVVTAKRATFGGFSAGSTARAYDLGRLPPIEVSKLGLNYTVRIQDDESPLTFRLSSIGGMREQLNSIIGVIQGSHR